MVGYSLDLRNMWCVSFICLHHRVELNTRISRKEYQIGVMLRENGNTNTTGFNVANFFACGEVAWKDQSDNIRRVVMVHLDFSATRSGKCEERDSKKRYARPSSRGT